MRLVFIGASRFGLRCLEALPGLKDVEVVGAVTAPEKFAISYRPSGVVNVLHADVGPWCRKQGIPCVAIEQGMQGQELFDTVRAWRPDAFLVAGWYHMVPHRWRELAPAYGLHASLLPDYSGGAPLVWAIINGERRSGITLFQLADGVDNGPILGQAETPIEETDTIATLYARIEEAGLALVSEHLPALARGGARLQPQDESRRRVFPQRAPSDGLIDWTRSSRELYNFIRAQTRPYPGAFTTWRGEPLHIWSARPASIGAVTAASPGTLSLDGERLLVRTGDGLLELLDVEHAGRVMRGVALSEIASAGVLGR